MISAKVPISWFSHGAPDAAVYMSMNGGEEVLFAKRPHGSQELSRIETDVTYEFTLYDACDRKNRLAQISVTRPSLSPIIASKRTEPDSDDELFVRKRKTAIFPKILEKTGLTLEMSRVSDTGVTNQRL